MLDSGGKMFFTMAGAMSTAELGLSFAEMIRQGKVHAICCTGANLEEDVFNLVAHDHYVRVPHYRDLTPADEQALLDRQLNRVTDTCIPEEEAMRAMEHVVLDLWRRAESRSERFFPHEFLYPGPSGKASSKDAYQIDPADSWMVAAAENDLPIFVPGWEDSTLGNIFAARGDRRATSNRHRPCDPASSTWSSSRRGTPRSRSDGRGPGFFQIGGGIAGDFPICVVPMLNQDLKRDVPVWSYFCQISDSTTSYGSYSGAVPNEKITWGKLAADTPKFVIESDATIVAPLIFAYLLGW